MQITGFYAALCAVLLIFLSLRVVRLRRSLQVGIGSSGQEPLARAIRAQANLTEYVPLALILLAALELQGVATVWIHGAGQALIIARLFHAHGLSSSAGRSLGRTVGTALTWAVMITLALANIALMVMPTIE